MDSGRTPINHRGNMSKQWVTAGLYFVYMKIAEPRIIRLLQFGVYVCMLLAGTLILIRAPHTLQGMSSGMFIPVLGGFLVLGGLCSGVAVLPGIWWLERAGLMLLGFGLLMYMVIVLWLNSSPIGVSMSIAFIITFIQRWLDIKGSQLAPLVPIRG